MTFDQLIGACLMSVLFVATGYFAMIITGREAEVMMMVNSVL